ncbi:hypothetical protein BpHYR1_023332 [Brachionus plicatilis]|uniref:Uncharacterized protein n=1 Tax=Brachionus plicatilis TaxID=10195 RepID=A0A3M7SRX3_BRAPC|nr:hypothetical protein BpHYR1_023332 [Brachionus plicatilis]
MNKNIILIAFLAFIIAFYGLVEAQAQAESEVQAQAESDVYSLLRRTTSSNTVARANVPTRSSKRQRPVKPNRPSNLEGGRRLRKPGKPSRGARVTRRPTLKARKNN